MSSFRKIVASGILIGMLLVAALVWATPSFFPHKQAKAAGPTLPYNATANGPYSVKGNMIVGANGQQYMFHGIGRDGLEYNCSGQGPLDQQHLAYMGSGVSTPGATYWGANTVRLPLSEGFWLNGAPGFPCSSSQYQNTVKQVVSSLSALQLNVIIDLQWTDAGGQSLQGGGPWAMPDADSVTFWQQVATQFKGNSNVLFELANEPHPASWSCWTGACTMTNDSGYSDDCQCSKTFTYQSVGMQALVNAVRNTGAQNIVIAGGTNWGYDLSQLGTYHLSGSNIVYDTHPYPYTDKLSNTWDFSFGNISSTYPVVSMESGEYDCDSTYLTQLYSYFDAHQISWVAWAWVANGQVCSYPQLVTDYQGTPSAGMGLTVYQHLHSYIPTASPVSDVWYFAEGRVGASFNEFLTIDNPDPVNNCSVTIQYLPETGSVVTKNVTVNHASRLTESVNSDMGIQSNSPTGLSVSSIVTVNSSPSCAGVVAERPLYFSWHGINSGSDVVGATHLGTTFYFADVPTGPGFTSFLTLLNPPGNGSASVTAVYYANGQAVGHSGNVTIAAGQRGTLYPNTAGLPAHVAVVLTSTQPIVAERPDYFGNVTMGNAGTLSGATSTVATQALSHDWLFAEGFTGGRTQEYLVISNLDSAAKTTANVNINLQLGNGSTRSYSLSVGPFSQTIWNVNQNVPNQAVSAEVTSTNAAIVVERQMFFHYGNPGSLQSMGGNDVIGQIGPVSTTAYSFSEGYSNSGYDEWLTLQNPTNNTESISITLVNQYGFSYSPAPIVVAPHSRSSYYVSSVVRKYMIKPGQNPSSAFAVSMSVKSAPGVFFVAERPEYWNTGGAGTQGGSDVIGYVGQ